MNEILVIDSVANNGAVSTTQVEQVVVGRQEVHVVSTGEQGPQGIPGIPGPTGGSAIQYAAGEALGGHRMVVLNDSQQAVYASNQNSLHAVKVLGITLGAANMGDTATIQTGGEITEPSWTWAINQPIYLGDNGLLTQTYPLTGFAVIVAFPISATKILLRIREPIVLN